MSRPLHALPVPGLVVLVLAAACGSTPRAPSAGAPLSTSDHRILDTRTGEDVSFEALVDELAGHDVVFLGEIHTNDEGHRLQLAITSALLERRGEVVLSLEMFERDVQAALDRYLAGEIDEETFLAGARPWPRYADHYRPGVELMREHGREVLAANVPRPLASRVSRAGLRPVLREPHAPRFVDAAPGPYYERFQAAMGDHGGMDGLDMLDVFASQCLKDAAMAESIADRIGNAAGAPPLVVHWCGRFHSDRGQGTVERLRARMPHLSVGIVSMSVREDLDDDLTENERLSGDYVLLVP